MKKLNLTLCLLIFSGLFTVAKAQGDDCSTAFQLNNVINYCSGAGTFTNVGSTASGFANASCVTGAATEDVWFQFTAVGTDILISAGGSGAGGTMVRPRIAMYTGSCGGTINQFGCANGTAGSGVTQLYFAPLTPGTVYFIRVSTTQAQEGTFELCVNNYTPSANPGADCGGAAFLCNSNPVSVGSLSGGGANADEPEASSCMEEPFGADEGNSSWFYWTCGTSGTLTLDLTPINPNDDIDFIVYQLAGPNMCGGRTILRCNTSACLNANGSTGLSLTDGDQTEDPGCDPGENAYCQYVNMVAGTSYGILVNNWSGNNGFTMNFGGTGTFLGPDPNISTSATTICAGQTVTFDGSASTNVANGLNWNFSNGGSPTSASGVGPHTITYGSPGSYVAILNGTDATGCNATEVANITVSPAPAAPTASDATYCQGQTALTLTATGTNLLWYTSATGGTGSATAPTPSTAAVGTTTYYVSQTPSGCESPRTAITITVNPGPDASAVSPVNLTCVPNTVQLSGSSTSGGVSYSWAGPGVVSGGNTATPTVNGAGTYTLTVSIGACTNTATVVVNPPSSSPQLTTPTANHNLTCTNTTAILTSGSNTPNTSLAWTGPTAGTPAGTTPSAASTTVNAAGTYTITVTDNSNGCTSVNSIVVTSNTTPPTVGAVSSQTLTCAVTNVSLSSTSAAGNTYAWTGPTAGTAAGTTPSSASTIVSAAGTYTVTVTDPANGCMNTATGVVSSNTVTPGVTMGSNQSITCAANTVSISGSGTSGTGTGVTYSWTPAGTTPTSSSTSVSAAGTYTLNVIDQGNGCTSSGTVAVTASTGLPNVTPGSNGTLTCLINNVTISGNSTTSGVTYAWTGPTVGTPAGSTPTSASTNVSTAGTYTLTVTDPSNNCVASTQVTVNTNLTTPQLTVGPNLLLSCSVSSVNLTASSTTPGVGYAWTGPSGSTPAGTTPFNSTTNVAAAGTYTVTVANPANGCVSTSTVLVSSNGSATIVNAGPASVVLPCGGGVQIHPTQQQGTYQYSWAGPNGFSSNNFNPPSATVAGTYTLTATNPATGCVSVDSVIVVPGTIPNAGFNPSTNEGYLPLAVTYTNTSTGSNNYQWFISPPSSLLPTAVSTNYSNTFNTPGTYTVMLVSGNGSQSCNDTAFTIIEVKEYATMVIPNIFSPNGDNENDILKPITTGMKELAIDIYNRWGEKMISFDGLHSGWNGEGKSEGTYYFIAKGRGEDGTELEKAGFVLLVR
jgi:gliding motility-associated-like protein